MTNSEFNQLKYGNVITDKATGRRMLVLHVKKDSAGNAVEVGYIDSLPVTSASGLDLMDATAEETLLVNDTVMIGVLQSRTI